MADIKYTPEKTGETQINKTGNVSYITFPAYAGYEELLCAFSTREGGVSKGIFSSMNLGRPESDSVENVLENYRIFAEAIGTVSGNFVVSEQQHTTNIKIAAAADRGKGITKARDYTGVDGFVTDEKELALCLLFADCVPVYLYDPRRHVIGLVHSGWRGTAGQIPGKAVEIMKEHFGSDPKDIISVIAPSICKDCYEVSADLYNDFSENFSTTELSEIFEPEKGKEDKFFLDLWRANRLTLLKTGVLEENIHTTDICTCCNSTFLFSHRASQGKRGNLAAVIMLRQ